MKVGDHAELVRSFPADAAGALARLTGTPVEPRGAADGAVPEPLLAALVSCLLGVHLPGPGTNYLKQDFTFPAPAPCDTPLTARVEITRIRAEKHLVDLATTCRTPAGLLVLEGRALVLVRDVTRPAT